jgi:hypothetical protein
MGLNISFTQEQNLISWESAFCLLGIKRNYLLLREAGIPEKVVNTPEFLLEASLHFWATVWTELTKPVPWTQETLTQSWFDEYKQENCAKIRTLLQDIFSNLKKNYGEDNITELYNWIVRHFIDCSQRNRWDIWNRLLLRLINSSSLTYPLFLLSLTNDKLELIRNETKQNENRLFIDEEITSGYLVDLLEEARKIPLLPIEQRMVTIKARHEGSESLQIDVLLILKQTIERECAYQLVHRFCGWLSEEEQQIFIEWGKKQAEIMQEPKNCVVTLSLG